MKTGRAEEEEEGCGEREGEMEEWAVDTGTCL